MNTVLNMISDLEDKILNMTATIEEEVLYHKLIDSVEQYMNKQNN